jgi:hypothetical protein
MKIHYESRKDCNEELIGKWVKCAVSVLLIANARDLKVKRWAQAIVEAAGIAGLFKNAVEFGQVLQIREEHYQKGERK